jgi:hypothetical protein
MKEYLALIVVLTGTAAVSGEQPQSLIERVFVLDPTATRCENCPGGDVPKEIQQIVSAADIGAYGMWIKRSFDLNEVWWDARLNRGDATRIYNHFDMDTDGGVRFQGRGFRIEFEKFDCWIWDCYKPRMWRIDDSGIRRWKRKVPFARAPVEPFVVGDYVLYVGGFTSVEELVIVDVDTGRVVETFAPAGEERGFWDSALMLFPSFYRDGYIYLKGTSHNQLDPVTRRPISETPAKTYVLKVRF